MPIYMLPVRLELRATSAQHAKDLADVLVEALTIAIGERNLGGKPTFAKAELFGSMVKVGRDLPPDGVEDDTTAIALAQQKRIAELLGTTNSHDSVMIERALESVGALMFAVSGGFESADSLDVLGDCITMMVEGLNRSIFEQGDPQDQGGIRRLDETT